MDDEHPKKNYRIMCGFGGTELYMQSEARRVTSDSTARKHIHTALRRASQGPAGRGRERGSAAAAPVSA